jgi:hypothetical protein
MKAAKNEQQFCHLRTSKARLLESKGNATPPQPQVRAGFA